jgi:hypothetical protein
MSPMESPLFSTVSQYTLTTFQNPIETPQVFKDRAKYILNFDFTIITVFKNDDFGKTVINSGNPPKTRLLDLATSETDYGLSIEYSDILDPNPNLNPKPILGRAAELLYFGSSLNTLPDPDPPETKFQIMTITSEVNYCLFVITFSKSNNSFTYTIFINGTNDKLNFLTLSQTEYITPTYTTDTGNVFFDYPPVTAMEFQTNTHGLKLQLAQIYQKALTDNQLKSVVSTNTGIVLPI